MEKQHVKLRKKDRDYLESLFAKGKLPAKWLSLFERGVILAPVADAVSGLLFHGRKSITRHRIRNSLLRFVQQSPISTEIVNYNGSMRYSEAVKGSNRRKTVEVGSLGAANAWGIYDMHGNVWELCEDIEPRSWEESRALVWGGGWKHGGMNTQSAGGDNDFSVNYRDIEVGFRLFRMAR